MVHFSALIFILGVCGCLGGDRDYDGYRDHNRDRNRDRNQYINGVSIVGSDYDEKRENIWRPCSLDDYHCMGAFLSKNGRCVQRDTSSPDPIYLPIGKFYYPVAALTITTVDATITGFNRAKVAEFYVNKDTGNVVIAAHIPSYNFTTNGFFSYQRAAREPIVLNDHYSFEQDDLLLTAAIPKVGDLRIDLADVHPSMPNAPPRYYIGHGASRSHNPVVKRGIARFEGNMVLATREALWLHSYYLMSIFIQSELCDFGIDPFRSYNGFVSFNSVVYRDWEEFAQQQ